MRIVVIGAGAMGSLFASHLAATGAEVWVYDVWREHVEAIVRDGLLVRRDGRETSVRLKATSDPAVPGPCDIAIVFVKYNQTRAAVEAARPMIGPGTSVVTLQNGLGNVEIIRAVLPKNRILFGLTTLTSELLGPGRVEASYAGRGDTWIWPLDGKVDRAVETVRDLLMQGGVNTAIAPDIEQRIWKKLIVNCCLNTMCAITGLAVGPLADRPESWPLLDGIADEIVTVAQRRSIPLDRDEAHVFLRSVAAEAGAHMPSMLVDVLHKRPTEIECLNGAVLRECARHGVPAPYNAAIHALVRVIEQTYQQRRDMHA